MEHWSAGDEFDDEDTGKILSLATGNIQTLPATTNHDQCVEDSSNFGRDPLHLDNVQQRFTVPSTALTSGGSHDLNRRRHAFKRLRRRFELSLRYQQRSEYRRYIGRPRKDTDDNGEIIWTDAVEEAFNNALVNIPPMGRRKKSQHGKSLGRNELIREWMLHETGIPRKRKQISSHIQVLDHVFKDFPDWKKLTKIPNATAAPEPELYDYYNDSVGDMVRNWPTLKGILVKSLLPDQRNLLLAPILRSNDSFSDRHTLSQLHFDMWVGPSTNVDRCLHRYTRTADHDTSLVKSSHFLNTVQDWRHRFPDLETIISEFSETGNCDVVLLDAHLQMMTDFPFEQVKLGINFQLEFSNAECRGVHAPGCLEAFSCSTRIYQNGNFLRQAEVDSCQVIGHGKVKPPFESRWWAQEFVRLTDRHRMAEDSGNQGDIAAAAEVTMNFFKSLTIVQQLFTCPTHFRSYMPDAGSSLHHQRAAVLLWTFSQATSRETAVTIACKLSLSSDKMHDGSFDSPNATAVSTDLINMGTGVFQNLYGPLPSFNADPVQEDTSDPEELCQDGFMITAQQQNLDLGIHFPFSSNMFEQITPNMSSAMPLRGTSGSVLDTSFYTNIDYLGGHDAYTKLNHCGNRVCNVPQLTIDDIDTSQLDSRRRPLEQFDTSTHDLLQAQLRDVKSEEKTSETGRIQPQDHKAVTNASTSHQRIFAMDDSQKTATDLAWDAFDVTGDFADLATLTPRPVLQHFHSFAGVSHTEDDSVDTPRRSFSKLMKQLEQNQDRGSMQHNIPTQIDSIEIERAQSQPAPDIRFDNNYWLLGNAEPNDGWTGLKTEEAATHVDRRDVIHSLCMQ